MTAAVDLSLRDDPQVVRALDAARSGALGQLVTVDLVRGSAYPPYEGGPLPPWYRDAGYPFRELGVPCLSLLQELLGPIEDVDARWSSHGGDPDLAFDDWRATVRCARGLGQLHLTWSATAPGPSRLILRGTRKVLRVEPFAKSSSRGLRDRVAGFYRRLAAHEPPAGVVEDAAQVVTRVEEIARAADADHLARLARFELAETVPFLVTGATGSLGKATVARLRAEGHAVRVFVRRLPATPEAGVEYGFGNLGDPVAVDRAVRGARTVIHAGAAMTGGWPAHRGGTVVGTQNVIDACRRHGVKQLVYISSMSVIDWAGSAGHGPVDEGAKLEPRADERGAYTRAKLEAEGLVVAAAQAGLPCVILRPGQIFGGGIALINGAVARSVGGRWVVLGDGTLELPLVYIDDVVDAILQAIDKQLTHGEIIQLVDPEHLTQREVLGLAGGTRPVLAVPRALVFALGKLSEYPLGALGRQSPVALYRLKSALARLRYESARASSLLGWHPRVGVREGIKRVAPLT